MSNKKKSGFRLAGAKKWKTRTAGLAAFAALALFGGTGAALALETVDLAGGAQAGVVAFYGAEAGDKLTGWDTVTKSCLLTGDLNGDGIDDAVIGTYIADGPANGRANAGEAYIYFGEDGMSGTKDIAGTEGAAPDVIIYGATASDQLTWAGAMAMGDVNNDGVNDLLLGAPFADGLGDGTSACGEVYVIYGSAALPAVIDLDAGDEDVLIYGADVDDMLTNGANIEASDINGDGIKDILLGATGGDGATETLYGAGEAYIIYGSDSLPAVIDLGAGDEDVLIYGPSLWDSMGSATPLIAADVNGDGMNDLLLSLAQGDGVGDAGSGEGEVRILYGSDSLPAVVNLADNDQDVLIYGAEAGDVLSHNGAMKTGDVNGDGIADILLGAVWADGPANGRNSGGEAYVIFGSTDLAPVMNVSVNADVTIYGPLANAGFADKNGPLAADVNGDGIDDILVGSYSATASGRASAGQAYVYFGSTGLSGTKDTAGTNGDAPDLVIHGASVNDFITSYGGLVTGDMNGDGIADILLAARNADGAGEALSACGEAYVVYGDAALGGTVDLGAGEEDILVYGGRANDLLGGRNALAVGDLNADGVDDMLVGAYQADGPADARADAGDAYLILGQKLFDVDTVKKTDHAGDSLGKDYGTARAFLDFDSGDSASMTQVKLTRNLDDVTTLAAPELAADMHWIVTSDRTGFSCDLTLHYLDSEIDGLTEGNLKLYKAEAVDGIFEEVEGAVFDTDQNLVTAAGLTGFSVFVISEGQPDPPPFNCFIQNLMPSFPKLFLNR